MPLAVRPPVETLPSYSLTGDLLGFLRCGLQYRYTRIGNLPASHPVQLWFGRFIHAVLEESFRLVKEGKRGNPPWRQDVLNGIMDRIDRRLATRNIRCWDNESEELARQRAIVAVNDVGPMLFPLISEAEVRVRGARKLPPGLEGIVKRDIDRYEMVGVIDVVTQVELFKPNLRGNELVALILEALPANPPREFEVIVDYKGMKRPDPSEAGIGQWEIYGWQVHTYASLRAALTTKQIIAGVLVYLNELVPTTSDFLALRRALRDGIQGAIVPPRGSADEKILLDWKPKDKKEKPPLLSFEFRLSRAIRIIPITKESIAESLARFDGTVGQIETSVAKEAETGRVISSWEKNSNHEPTCAACDSRTYCPAFKKETEPRLPGYRI